MTTLKRFSGFFIIALMVSAKVRVEGLKSLLLERVSPCP